MYYIDLDQVFLYEFCVIGVFLLDGGCSVVVYLDKILDDGEVIKFSGLLFQDDFCGNDCFFCYVLFFDFVYVLVIWFVNRSGK